MRRSGFFRNLKSLSKTAAILAVFSFGFQSIALPIHATVHATVHAAQNAVKKSTSVPSVVETDCELCDLATHQALNFSTFTHFGAVETVTVRISTSYTETFAQRLAHLPPVRGPPARA
jgi:hypothetical protein